MSIESNCMVVNLSIAVWAGHKLDKNATQRVTEEAQAAMDAARVNKHIVPKESLKDVTTAMGALRTFFYYKTLPWKDNGDRLLPRGLYFKFMEEYAALLKNFNDAVDDFVAVKYPRAMDQASFRMGDMYNPNDYPSPEALRRKFCVNLDISPVASANDFRVAIDKTAIAEVRKDIEARTNERVAQAMSHVWDKLFETASHLATKLEGDTVFRNSTFTNLTDLLDIVKELNILDDVDLEKSRQQLRDAVMGVTVHDLRKDDAVRTAVAEDVNKIVENMRGFMAAFGGGK